MKYINSKLQDVNLKKDYPNTSFPKDRAVLDAPDGETLYLVHPSRVIPGPDDVAEPDGYEIIDGRAFVKLAIRKKTAEEKHDVFQDFIRNYCSMLESAGTTYKEWPVATDLESKLNINGAVTRAILDNDITKEYEYYPPGLPAVVVTNADFMGIGYAQATHVQKVKSAKDAAQVKLDKGEYENTNQIRADIDAGVNPPEPEGEKA